MAELELGTSLSLSILSRCIIIAFNPYSMQPYSIVVATRNRLSDLLQSLPTFLSQSVPAQEIIVVDSSDDHEGVVRGLSQLEAASRIKLIILKSPRGLPIQRNLGLNQVSTGIVFYPDDDSLWFPNTAEEQLKVYSADTDGQISGVCGREVSVDPRHKSRDLSPCGNHKSSLMTNLRVGIESSLFRDPVQTVASEFMRASSISLSLPGVKKVAFMTGFRMSFRTSAIRKYKFDEALLGYAPFEDIDASMSAWKSGAVVAATSAYIYHNKNASSRGDGFTIGATHLLNRAYVICKHSAKAHPARKQLVPFSYYKWALYASTPFKHYGRARLKGAWRALSWVKLLAESPRSAATDNYLQARLALFGTR